MKAIIIIIIIFLLVIGAFFIWLNIPPKNKVKIYWKKVKKAEKKKGTPLTKDEKETIARKVDNIGSTDGPRIDIDSVDWRFDVDDADVTYRKEENEK